MKKNKRETGRYYESVAVRFLEQQGYRIKERNYRCRFGEIDIIAAEDTCLCFIEVKYRSGVSFGYPSEAVDERKQQKIRLTAGYYQMQHGLGEDALCRFDVVEIVGDRIRVIRNAFYGA